MNTRNRTTSWMWILALTLILVFLALPGFGHAEEMVAPLTLGWVGNMFPVGGSATTITAPASFSVYVQVWKDGVTNAPGQGANITCSLYRGSVTEFGGSWSNITDTVMTYNTDIGNNDEYMATISPSAGKYEFTAYCKGTCMFVANAWCASSCWNPLC